MDSLKLADTLYQNGWLKDDEFLVLLQDYGNEAVRERLAFYAREVSRHYFNHKVYTRGLIEFSNYCKNNCYYCGIRRDNDHAQRYRLTKAEILDCCKEGYKLDFRTFVLQSGEDEYYTDDKMIDIISSIHHAYPECAITLSLGEKSKSTYQKYYAAGADRYLLRHETSNSDHYQRLHPEEMSIRHRMQCLLDLKAIGFQTGCGIMVGSPYQKMEYLVEDLRFMKDLQPEMVGIGPFLPHHETPFCQEPAGSLELTLFLLSIIRLILPDVLLPATTALATLHPLGREKGILAGANVVMPNLSPIQVRKKYMLYDNKICTGDEAAECRDCISKRIKRIGYDVVIDRGDHKRKIEESKYV